MSTEQTLMLMLIRVFPSVKKIVMVKAVRIITVTTRARMVEARIAMIKTVCPNLMMTNPVLLMIVKTKSVKARQVIQKWLPTMTINVMKSLLRTLTTVMMSGFLT